MKEVKATYKESEARYQALLNATDEGYFVAEILLEDTTCVNYRFLDVNPQFEQLTGLKDPIGKLVLDLIPNLENHWLQSFGEVALTGKAVRFENVAQAVGEGYFDVYAFRIGDEKSRQVGVLFKDISRRKQDEHNLQASNDLLEEKVAERTQEVRDLAAELTLAEQKERQALAKTLHDGVQQELYGIQFALAALRNSQDADVLNTLAEVNTLLRKILRMTRDVTTELRPVVLDDPDLCKALQWLAHSMKVKHGLTVSIEGMKSCEVQNEAMRVLIFMLARELLFNIVKHANVKEAQLWVTFKEDKLFLDVKDKGKGFSFLGRGSVSKGSKN